MMGVGPNIGSLCTVCKSSDHTTSGHSEGIMSHPQNAYPASHPSACKVCKSHAHSTSWHKNHSDPKPLPNPDPKNFNIIMAVQIGKHSIVQVQYPDCTNFEGNKIILYKNTNLMTVQTQVLLDPHFCDHVDKIKPFARFTPTADGWYTACRLAAILK